MESTPSSQWVIKNLIDCPEHARVISEWCWNEWEPFNKDLGLANEEEFYEDLIGSCVSKVFQPICLVALTSTNEVCGCVQLEPCDMSIRDKYTPWMTNLYVGKAFRRQGVATALQKAFLDLCRSLDIQRVYLWTEDQQEMYRRRGWQFVEDVEYIGHQTTIMGMDL